MYPSLVSICIPTFNGEEFIQESLASLVAQDFRDVEVIISDDDSTDGTLAICQEFQKQVDFPVHIYRNEPKGIGANWNNCIAHSSGEYIKFLFQDDVLEPSCISLMVQVLDAQPDIGLVASKRSFLIESSLDSAFVKRWVGIFEDLQKEFKAEKIPFLRLTKNIFRLESFTDFPLNKVGEPSAVMFRRKFFKEIGPFREDLKQILDYEYWYRILKIADIAILPQKLVGFRLHGAQATNKNSEEDIKDYRAYDRLLYDSYLPLLDKTTRTRLKKKFHPMYISIGIFGVGVESLIIPSF